MLIQFHMPLKDRYGKDFSEPDPEKSIIGQAPATRIITLEEICCQVLDTTFQDEAQEGLKPKLRRAELIDKITQAAKEMKPLEMLDADRDMIKERIGKRNYPVVVTASAVRLLDTDAVESKVE